MISFTKTGSLPPGPKSGLKNSTLAGPAPALLMLFNPVKSEELKIAGLAIKLIAYSNCAVLTISSESAALTASPLQ
jgi:hypothetical protein